MFDPATIDALAETISAAVLDRIAPALADASPADGWLDSKAAAVYLGLSVDALHKRTAERSIPFSQDAPGGRCYFKRSELDEWRRSASAAKPLP